MVSTTLRRVASTVLLTLLLGAGGVAAATSASASGDDGVVRPANGEVVLTRNGSGPGRLEVEGGPTDAALTLAAGDRAVRTVYVRAGQEATVDDVPDGTYTVYVTSGSDWDDSARRFTRDATYERWPGDTPFTAERDRDGITYSIWTFELTETPEGTVTPEPVGEGAFPR